MSDTPIKNGKKPASLKPDPKQALSAKRIFNDPLAYPPAIKKYADENGLVLCWRNYNEIMGMDGIDPDNWRVFKKTKEIQNFDILDGSEAIFGGGSSGLVRRGDLVLGYKTKAQHDEYHEYIRQKTDRITKSANAGASFIEEARKYKGQIKVHSGLDDQDE